MSDFRTPTVASLYRAKNPLSTMPEFQTLRSQLGLIAKDSSAALRLEEDTHLNVRAMARRMHSMQSALSMLTEIVVDEINGLKHEVVKRDERIAELEERVAETEDRQAEYRQWSKTVRDDLLDLRHSMERELVAEAQQTRRVAARQNKVLQSLADKSRRLEAEISERMSGLESSQEATRRELVAYTERALLSSSEEIRMVDDKWRHMERQMLDVATLLKSYRDRVY